MCANLRAGSSIFGARPCFVRYDPELPSLRFALSQFNLIVRILLLRDEFGRWRILEMSSRSAHLRDGSSLVESSRWEFIATLNLEVASAGLSPREGRL